MLGAVDRMIYALMKDEIAEVAYRRQPDQSLSAGRHHARGDAEVLATIRVAFRVGEEKGGGSISGEY